MWSVLVCGNGAALVEDPNGSMTYEFVMVFSGSETKYHSGMGLRFKVFLIS